MLPDKPTAKQLASLDRLLAHLTREYDIDPKNILKHSEVKRDNPPTECPGDTMDEHLPIAKMKQVALQKALEFARKRLQLAEQKLQDLKDASGKK